MKETAVLGELETLAQKLGVEVRYEEVEGDNPLFPGGMCRIRGRQVIIINQRSPAADRVRTMVKALRSFDLGGIYLRPALRELLDPGEDE